LHAPSARLADDYALTFAEGQVAVNAPRLFAKAEFIGKLKIRFRFPAILTQFSVWGQACKLCLKMRFPQNQHF
jgi:hypothetical protein